MTWSGRYLFVSNSDNGQTAPLVAIMLELAKRGNQCIMMSGASVLPRVQKIQKLGSYPVQTEANPTDSMLKTYPIVFVSLGTSPVLSYLDYVDEQPERFHSHCCAKPGKVMGWVQLYKEVVPDSTDEYLRMTHLVRDYVEKFDADMIIVDNFSPFAVDGVRLTKRPFIETAPGSVMGVASQVNPFKQPLPMSGGCSGEGGLFVILSNFIFIFNWLYFYLFDPWSTRRRKFRKEVLKLSTPNPLDDAIMPPAPGVLPQQISTLAFSVAGLDIYASNAYDKSVFFVGPCFVPNALPDTNANAPTPVDDPVLAWMDELYAQNKRVVCINMGTIYYYLRKDYDNLLRALHMLHERMPNVAILWKIPDRSQDVQPIPKAEEANLPSFIYRVAWIPDMFKVMQHPALGVVMHHGGGNSLNEALAYGVPQFCVSQWVDTHDIGLCIQNSGVGLWADHSPEFVPEDVSSKLATLLEDKGLGFRHRALAWKLKTQQAGGTSFAADVIQSYVSGYTFEGGNSKAPVANAM